MASLKVSPGPLPEDGTRFNPEVDLAAFVNGTRVYDIGIESFTDSEVTFIISQTDAPASASVNRALSWFKRGEGVLYHAHWFTPTEGPRSGVTDFRWVAASGSRKEMIVEYRFPVRQPGGVLRQTGEPTTVYGVQLMAHRFMMPRVMQTQFTSHTDISVISDSTASWLAHWAERHNDPIFVALDTTATEFTPTGRAITNPCGYSGHDFHTAVECGFCQIAVGSGYTAPGRLSLFKGLNDARFQTPTGVTFQSDNADCAIALDSSITGAGTILGFLRPSVTHRNFF